MRKTIRSVLCNIVCNNCAQCDAQTYEQTNSSLDWVLSHWAHFTVLDSFCIVYYCVLRFESKHQRCKKLLHISGNYKNVLKTCAFRHQHDVAFRCLMPQETLSDVVVGTGSVVTLSELSDGCEINNCLGNVGM